jgi:hypothetical protein
MLENIAGSVCLEQSQKSMWRFLTGKRRKSDKHIHPGSLRLKTPLSRMFPERADRVRLQDEFRRSTGGLSATHLLKRLQAGAALTDGLVAENDQLMPTKQRSICDDAVQKITALGKTHDAGIERASSNGIGTLVSPAAEGGSFG